MPAATGETIAIDKLARTEPSVTLLETAGQCRADGDGLGRFRHGRGDIGGRSRRTQSVGARFAWPESGDGDPIESVSREFDHEPAVGASPALVVVRQAEAVGARDEEEGIEIRGSQAKIETVAASPLELIDVLELAGAPLDVVGGQLRRDRRARTDRTRLRRHRCSRKRKSRCHDPGQHVPSHPRPPLCRRCRL